MNYPMILICGPSGSGKSYSIRGLDKSRTCILNIERKILPFCEALQFGSCFEHSTLESFEQGLDHALKLDSYDTIVIESFSKYVEMLLTQSKIINKGYEIWNYYNEKISKLLDRIKDNRNKFVILLSIDERVEFINPSGAITTSRRAKVAGKQWEGLIEKEFTIVLFTDVKQDKGKDSEYRFLVNNDGTCSAKSPPECFKHQGNFMSNDLASVIEQMRSYYSLKAPTPLTPQISLETPKPKLPPMNTYVKS